MLLFFVFVYRRRYYCVYLIIVLLLFLFFLLLELLLFAVMFLNFNALSAFVFFVCDKNAKSVTINGIYIYIYILYDCNSNYDNSF